MPFKWQLQLGKWVGLSRVRWSQRSGSARVESYWYQLYTSKCSVCQFILVYLGTESSQLQKITSNWMDNGELRAVERFLGGKKILQLNKENIWQQIVAIQKRQLIFARKFKTSLVLYRRSGGRVDLVLATLNISSEVPGLLPATCKLILGCWG